ncbi:MAG: hypothetical protein AAGJ95_15225 [Cyanobacteria bacterium J06554_11]
MQSDFFTVFIADLLDPQCRDTLFLEGEHGVFSVLPVVTVAKPWLGRHQIYSIFALPEQHRLRTPTLLTVKGIGRYRREGLMLQRLDHRPYGIGPGYYAVKVHLRTRLAWFILFRGLYGQLQDSRNWSLTYTLSSH